MKRILSTLAAFLVLLALPALAESDFPGVWIETEGYGTLTIFADGTARMDYYDGTVTECPWALTEEGAVFTEGQWLNSPMVLLDNNTLSVADGWMIFAREGFLPTTDEALLLGAEPVGEEGTPYLGSWLLSTLILDGEETDPSLFGMTLTLTFNADGTIISDDGLEPYTTTWFVSYGNAVVEGDILCIDESDMLVFNTSDGAMVFARMAPENANPDITETEISATDVTTPADAPSEEEQLLALLQLLGQVMETDTSSGIDYLNTKFVCTSYSTSGITLEGSTLGAEYGVYFRDDNTADLTLAGYVMENLPYTITDEGIYAVNYYGTFFNCTPTETGFDLDYYGTMTMHCIPAE